MKNICRSVFLLMISCTPVTAQSSWAGSYVGGALVLGDAAITAQGGLADQLDRRGIDETLYAPQGRGVVLHVGRDWQKGRLVMGLGAEYMAGHMTVDAADTRVGAISMTPRLRISDRRRIVGRVGYDAGQWMPYVVAGQEIVQLSIEDGVQAQGDILGDTFGWGVEHRFRSGFTTFAEYSRTDFDTIPGSDNQLEVSGKDLRLGANFRF